MAVFSIFKSKFTLSNSFSVLFLSFKEWLPLALFLRRLLKLPDNLSWRSSSLNCFTEVPIKVCLDWPNFSHEKKHSYRQFSRVYVQIWKSIEIFIRSFYSRWQLSNSVNHQTDWRVDGFVSKPPKIHQTKQPTILENKTFQSVDISV